MTLSAEIQTFVRLSKTSYLYFSTGCAIKQSEGESDERLRIEPDGDLDPHSHEQGKCLYWKRAPTKAGSKVEELGTVQSASSPYLFEFADASLQPNAS